jgi:hypothetical protein
MRHNVLAVSIGVVVMSTAPLAYASSVTGHVTFVGVMSDSRGDWAWFHTDGPVPANYACSQSLSGDYVFLLGTSAGKAFYALLLWARANSNVAVNVSGTGGCSIGNQDRESIQYIYAVP